MPDLALVIYGYTKSYEINFSNPSLRKALIIKELASRKRC